MERGFKTYTFA